MGISSTLKDALNQFITTSFGIGLGDTIDDASTTFKQVAMVEWDFEVDGAGGSGQSVDLTSKAINLFPVGSIITEITVIAIEGLAGTVDAKFALGDGNAVDIFFGQPQITEYAISGTRFGSSYYGGINSIVLVVSESPDAGVSEVSPNIVFTSSGTGDITAGKLRFYFEYYTPPSDG